jgi:hypothetical protein
MCVPLEDLVNYTKRGIRKSWQVVFEVLFLGKLCSNLPTVRVRRVVRRAGMRGR